MPIFENNGKKQNVQDVHIGKYMELYPDATTIMERGGKKYRVRAEDYNTFLNDLEPTTTGSLRTALEDLSGVPYPKSKPTPEDKKPVITGSGARSLDLSGIERPYTQPQRGAIDEAVENVNRYQRMRYGDGGTLVAPGVYKDGDVYRTAGGTAKKLTNAKYKAYKAQVESDIADMMALYEQIGATPYGQLDTSEWGKYVDAMELGGEGRSRGARRKQEWQNRMRESYFLPARELPAEKSIAKPQGYSAALRLLPILSLPEEKGKKILGEEGYNALKFFKAYNERFAQFNNEAEEDAARLGFAETMAQGFESMGRGAEYFLGESYNAFSGSALDDKAIIDNWDEFFTGKKLKTAQQITDNYPEAYKDYRDYIQGLLAENGNDIDKVKKIIKERSKDATFGDRLIIDADNAMNSFNPEMEGALGLVAKTVPQMVGVLAAIVSGGAGAPALATGIGYGNMALLTASTMGQSMKEARDAGATNLETWLTGIADGAIELVTEKIPFDNWTKGILRTGKGKIAGELVESMTKNPAAREEFELLLKRSRKELDIPAFSGNNIKKYLAGVAAEGASEFTAEALQTLTKRIYENPEDYPTIMEAIKNGWEGAKAGLLMGAVTGAVVTSQQRRANDARRKKQGFVEVASLEIDGRPYIGEIVGKTNDGGWVVTINGEDKVVKSGDIKDKVTFSYDEFRTGEIMHERQMAFDEGYSQEPTGETAVNNIGALEAAENEVRRMLGLANDADIDVEVAKFELTDEEAEAVDNYRKAKARFEGTQQRFQETRDAQYAESDRSIDERSNKRNPAMVYSTMYDGQQVYITDGDVVLNEDGTIDYNNSSEALYITYPDGHAEQVSVYKFIEKVNAGNTEELKAQERAQIDQNWRNEFDTAEISAAEQEKRKKGLLFNLKDGVGAHTIEVLEEGVDDSKILFDGKEMPISTDELNQWRQEAGVQREVAPVQSSAPTVAPIPIEKRGKEERAAYHLAPIERTLEDLHDGALEPNEITALINARIKEAYNDVQALEKKKPIEPKKPVMGASKEAYLIAKAQAKADYEKAQAEWQTSMDEAQQRLNYYNELYAREQEITKSETREAYDNVQPREVVEITADEFIANNLPKITPESFKAETGLSNSEQAELVGYIAGADKGGVSVERAAEIIMESYGDELRGLGFQGDMQDVRDIIIDILSQGNPRSYAKSGIEQRRKDSISQQRAEMESVAASLGFESVEEWAAYEEQVIPGIIQMYTGFDYNEYYNNLAENYEYDTTREGETVGRGGELLQGEQPVDNTGAPVAEGNERGAVSDSVQSDGANAQASGNQQVTEPVGNSEQLSSSEIPNNQSVAEGNAPGQSGIVDNNSANTLQNGNNELNLQKENESDNESNQNDIPVGGQVPQSVPQGEHGTQTSLLGGVQETAARLRERIESAQGDSKSGLREVENRVTREFAQENGLWIENEFKLGVPFPSGDEHNNYIDAENQVVYKVNNRMHTPSILGLLDRIEQHNKYFPDSKYSLVGFTSVSDNGDVMPVFAQDFVPNARMATVDEIDSYMGTLGFTRVGDGRYSNGEVVIKDLKPRNVLVNPNGDVFVVDAEFEQEVSVKSGEIAENGGEVTETTTEQTEHENLQTEATQESAQVVESPAEASNDGPVNMETLQLNMSKEDFNALLSSGDKAAISEYLAEMDGLLRVGVGSPLDGRDAIVKEYRGLVEQYGSEENIPADVAAGINERIAPYNALQRAVFDRKYALQDRLREIEATEQRAKELAEKETKAEHKQTAFGGFLAGKTDLGASAAEKALNKKYDFDGKVMTVAEFVEEAVGNGDAKLSTIEEPKYKGASRAAWNRMDARQQEADAKRVKESGTKTVYTVNDHDLGKTAYDYAKFLLDKKAEQEKAAAKQKVKNLIQPFAKEKAAEQAPIKIEDVGEKIGGARKDIIRQYADKIKLDGKTFSTMFPKPDIDKLVEAGLPKDKVATVKAMYDNAKREFEMVKKRRGKDKALQASLFYAMYAKNVLTGEEENFDLAYNGFVFTEWGKEFMKANIALYKAVFNKLGTDYGKVDLRSYFITPLAAGMRENFNLKKLNEENSRMQQRMAEMDGRKVPEYKDGDVINFVGEHYSRPSDQFETLEEAVNTMVERISKEVKVDETNLYKVEAYWKKDALGRADYSKAYLGIKVRGFGTVDVMEFKNMNEANTWLQNHREDFQQMAAAKEEQVKAENKKPLPKYVLGHSYNEAQSQYSVFADFGKEGVRVLKTFDIPQTEGLAAQAKARSEVYKNDVLPYMNSEEALSLANGFAQEIRDAKSAKQKPVTVEKKSRERVGVDWRNGKDATPEMFVDVEGKEPSVFGFRAIEFGNYVSQKERQQFLNDIYDALMDMSEILGVSPRALSLGGKLALAVGARGTSGASGHYEPYKNVINITKTRGTGVLAHEWLHAFDRYFSNFDENAVYPNGVMYATQGMFADNTRKEVKEAFDKVMAAIKGGDYEKRSMRLGEYWASDKELAARALQDYIIRKLDDRGQKNDFLSNHVAPEEWDGDAKGYPFPLGEDAKRIADAFDNLFATLEEKTTEDGKVVLYRSAKEKRKNNSSNSNDNEDWLSLPFANNKDYGRRESDTGSQKRGGNDSGYNPMARFLGRVVEEILSESEKRGYGEPSNEIRWAIIENEKQNGKVYTSSLIQEEIVEVLRRLSNNEIDAVLSLFQETLNEEWIKDEMYSEDREEVEAVIRLINRFKAKNERKYIIEKLSGVNLGEGVAQSRIDELFDLYNSDKELAELYDRIKERAKEVGLSYSFSDNMEDSTYGKYSPYDNHVELNAHLLYSSILPQQDKAASIAHEIIHAVTQYAIRIQENRNKGIAPRVNISQELLDAAQTLIDVYEKAVRDNPELKHAKYNSERREYSDYIFYGTESVHEMVSELSNPEFRDKLKKVKYDDRSIWQAIWDAIKSIFVDVKYKKRSAYKDISKAFDTLVEKFDKNAYAEAWDITQPLAKKENKPVVAEMQEGETRFGVTETEIARNTAIAVGEKLNTPVSVIEDSSALPENRRDKKGWYDPKTGDVAVVMGNHISTEDVVETVLHEVVGHKGLRAVMGEKFDEFLDGVYKNGSPRVKRGITDVFYSAIKGGHALTMREATEEYVAGLAERDFEGFEDIWNAIKQWFRDFFRNFINIDVTDGELRYMLWKNYNRMKSGPIEMIIDRAMEARTDTGDKGTMFRRASTGGIGERYDRRVEGKWNKFKEGWYDATRSIRVAQEEIERESGKEISDSANIYDYANHIPSINRNKMERFDIDYIQPFLNFLKAVRNRTLNSGEKLDEQVLGRYANAKHGLERNREMSVRKALTEVVDGERKFNQEAYDQYRQEVAAIRNNRKAWLEQQDELDSLAATYGAKIKDYSGLTAIFSTEQKRKYSDIRKAAVDMVLEVEGEINSKKFWEHVSGINGYSLKESFESGLLSKKDYDNISDMYQYYVPLRGHKDTMAEDVYEYIEEKKSNLNGVVKTAHGRTSEAEDIFATMLNMANSAIVFGSKNRLKQRLLNLTLMNRTPLLSVGEAWYSKVGEEYVPMYPNINEKMTAEEIAAEHASFEERMKELEKQGLAMKHRQGVDLRYAPEGSWAKNQHAVSVKRNGKEYIVYVNASPKLAQAVNGLLLEDDGNWFLNSIDRVNRWRAKTVTGYSPSFVARNLVRDFQSSSVVYSALYGAAAMVKFDANVTTLIPRMHYLYALYKKNRLDMSNATHRYFKEFLENGGETGYTEMISIDEYQKKIKKYAQGASIGDYGKAPIKAAAELVEFANRGVENVCRFAAYMTSREAGMSILKSVNDAKEVSVNFNRKGSGAYGQATAKRLYMFLNPAIQAMVQRIELTKKYPKRMAAVYATEFAMGAAMPALFALLYSLLGGDDDEALGNYYNLTNYKRRSNICLPLGDGCVTIPLAHESRVAFGLGELITSAIMGHTEYDNVGVELFNTLTQSLPINPVEGMTPGDNVFETIGLNVAPDAVKPFVEILVNKDFAGNTIHNASDFNKHYPEHERGKRGAGTLYTLLSEALSGEYERNGWDDTLGRVITPSSLEHLAKSYLGGLYTTANEIVKSVQWAAGNEEFAEFRNIPIANGFYTSTEKYESKPSAERTRRDWEKAYKFYAEEVSLDDGTEKNYRRHIKEGDAVAEDRYNLMVERGEALRVDIFNDGRDVLSKLYDEMDAAREAKNFKRVEELDKLIYNQKRFVVERMELLRDDPMSGYLMLRMKTDDAYGVRETYGDKRDMDIINDFQTEVKPILDNYPDGRASVEYGERYSKELNLLGALKKIERAVSQYKSDMKKNDNYADEYMTEIRKLRAEAIELINRYYNE